ncbi:T-cell leukemia homeobox protein 1 isoform X3 [Mobula hypostoma]|uniref:T-cell leukemia homeobox protein 1 isoform X3 n=1 Tax=Mobula hypostoma TaxID=723540 RepID=UPI002FC2BADF
MDPLGGPHPHSQHEPISFGIDQILNNPDQGSCMIPNSRLQDVDYGLGCMVSGSYNNVPVNYANNGGGGGYNGACSLSSLASPYGVNLGMNGNGLNPAGVIRVPAHRPVTAGVHQPMSTGSAPGPAANNSLGNMTFPWMESNRRYTKDRFTDAAQPAEYSRQLLVLPQVSSSFSLEVPAAVSGWEVNSPLRQRLLVPGSGSATPLEARVMWLPHHAWPPYPRMTEEEVPPHLRHSEGERLTVYTSSHNDDKPCPLSANGKLVKKSS